MTSAVQEVSAAEKTTSGAEIREPNFFIVGAAKAGTTSLHEYLRQHPDVFMPGGDLSRKEPSHFCDPIPPWQEAYRDFNTYRALFAEARDEKAVGEASAGYLISPGAEARIHARYPHARIVIVLRNPAERVYSMYTYMCQFGLEPSPSFERALAEEDERAAIAAQARENWFPVHAILYFRYALVAHYIERFLRRFPREQVHFVLFDDLKARPQETTSAVFEFLGVDPTFTPSFKIHNRTWVPFSIRFQHFLAMQCRVHPMLPQRTPVRYVDRRVLPFLSTVNALLGTLRTRRMNPATRKALLNRYRDDIRRTEELIGRSLAGWLKDA